jgi:uncharacterized protein
MKHKIAMSGATGFIGSNLSKAFKALLWDIIPLGISDFSLSTDELVARMSGADVVVNLAGAPVTQRWTAEHKKEMYDSRIGVTRRLADACAAMDKKPELFISTSAVGYYSSEGKHTEDNFKKAEDFLGNLTQDWEREALLVNKSGIRTVIFRFGIVLGKDGGVLKQMLVPFKKGLGGTIGDGTQGFSWVHIHDLVRAYEAAVEDSSYEGIYNLTAPSVTTNRDLTQALSAALGIPAILRIPIFVLRLQFGEGADAPAGGQFVTPKRLLDKGFSFEFRDINKAVKDCVG